MTNAFPTRRASDLLRGAVLRQARAGGAAYRTAHGAAHPRRPRPGAWPRAHAGRRRPPRGAIDGDRSARLAATAPAVGGGGAWPAGWPYTREASRQLLAEERLETPERRQAAQPGTASIGRASCRGRVCPYG